MKRLMGCALALLLVLSTPAIAGRVTNTIAFPDTLTTGTSAQTIYSSLINIAAYDYVGFNIFCDVTTGGNSGSAAISVEGRGKGQAAGWTTLWLVDFADSLNVTTTITLSSTADLYKHFIVTAVPLERKTEAANRDMVSEGLKLHVGNILPFEILRVKVVDTNWNAGAKFYGNVILGN